MTKHLLLLALLAGSAHAYEAQVRKGALTASLEAFVGKAGQDTGVAFEASDFLLIEDRKLATSHYQMYIQTVSGVPVGGSALRIWSDLKTEELILGEMHLNEAAKRSQHLLMAKFQKAKFTPRALQSLRLSNAINKMVAREVGVHPTDARVLGLKSRDQWLNGDLVRTVEVRGRRGVHHITVSLLRNVIVEKTYREFPQVEKYQTVRANVFPIYEEVEGTGEKLPYEVRELRYIDATVRDGGENPLGELANERFPENRYSDLLAETSLGQQHNLWSTPLLRKKAANVLSQLPLKANGPDGLLLQGKYVTINLHPGVREVFKGTNFEFKNGLYHIVGFDKTEAGLVGKLVSGVQGKPLLPGEGRLPVRLHDHDTQSYINNGFDEVQVYYGVTALMESLVEMGFTDPELSEVPFHAFLYDPDIGMKDNAYYWDNTINFTTYNPKNPNLARDNPTIWHELGHAIMERLMGVNLQFGDSKGGYGGLSEGMADFVAILVVEHQTKGENFAGKSDFRIMNNTGFYLTNEFHDEGEAYGGAMNDMLQKTLSLHGRAGLHAFTDLTLEAMRLTRNHPALTAKSWFEHMLYADELGSSVRLPGQFKVTILSSLMQRNFSLGPDVVRSAMKLMINEETELDSSNTGSREKPFVHCDGNDAEYNLKLHLTSGTTGFIRFPATVKVEYQKGALQGAIKWEGEATNPQVYTVNSEEEVLDIPLKASAQCETVNQPDGSCKDYAYVQVYNQGDSKPRAKKRFYLRMAKECPEEKKEK